MNRLRGRRHHVEHDNVHRWLVSYADYMTLLFALFVVLYAMAMIHDKPFESVTESIGRVFQADKDKPKNRGHGDDILLVNTSKTEKELYGNGILEVAGSELTDNDKMLSNITESEIGTNLTQIEKQLNTALYNVIESGFAKLEADGNWLEIELNSGLLFPSGSSSPTNAAREVLSLIYDVLNETSNYIRIRGFTDNEVIENEIFSSNWELSVFRATAILRLLESFEMNPARMAIEGYGQYYPSADNSTAEGRAKNRKVVIAISKFGLNQESLLNTPTIKTDDVKVLKQALEDNEVVDSIKEDNKIRVIQLENGGTRITTRKDDGTQP